MRTLTKLIFALILAAVASVEVVAQKNSDLVGSYLFRFEFGGTRIILQNNGRYTAATSDCTGVTTESGPYSVSNNVIRFTTLKLTRRDNGRKNEQDLTKRKARKKYMDTDEPFKVYSWELQVIRWGERVYLLHPKSFGDLIEAINLGFEPRSVDGYSTNYGDIYLREGDEIKRVTGPPPLPEEFVRGLLPAPVIATILELKTEGEFTVATIDRGSADGLKVDMRLVPVTPTIYFQPYRVRSIAEHSAEVLVLKDVKVGDQMSTRVADVLRYVE